MAAMWRRNIATGDNLGFKISTEFKDEQGSWSLGVDSHSEKHNSNIDNPNNPMFFVENFNNAKRDVVGAFAERKQALNEHWLAELGLRYNRVEMDTDNVDGSPAMMSMMGMAPGRMLRDSFNNSQHQNNDDNIDWVAKFYYQPGDTLGYYAGLARKTRSASYQERYLWLPLEATSGLADGRTYTGNTDLNPEVSHELELGADYKTGALSLSPRLFYRQVDDFIQGTETGNSNAALFVNMMNMMNGSSNAAPLEFNNVDAELYGFDMDWSFQINSRWSASGVINYVRGKRDDINDNLYRLAPANTLVALHYQANQWALTAESVLYAEQNKVSTTNSEQKTAGYGLLNLKGYWQLSNELRLGFGLDNIFDKHYRSHLAGYNRAVNNDIPRGERLPGYGRNAFARIDYQW